MNAALVFMQRVVTQPQAKARDENVSNKVEHGTQGYCYGTSVDGNDGPKKMATTTEVADSIRLTDNFGRQMSGERSSPP